ncbi:MAG: ChbG/HpnK family deacetylase [Anaerolineaceae bacterium]
MVKQLIVNADDYGHTAGISRGIREAHLTGLVTSTTVMMNRPDAKAALEQALETCPKLGLGVHLCLTSGQPSLPVERVQSLVRPDGNFFDEAGFLARLHQIKMDEVHAEWGSQIERFESVVGHAPDHLDSHHHSSYFSKALLEGMLALASEYHCRIRQPFGEDSGNLPGELSNLQLKQMMGNISDTGYFPKLLTPQDFLGGFYDEGVSLDSLKAILKRIVEHPTLQSFELMCHPAFVDDELVATSSYNQQRSRERELLQDHEIVRYARSHLDLITFRQLKD